MFAVIRFLNGGYKVEFEGSDPYNMEYQFYNYIANIMNDPGAAKGCAKLVDENLDVYDGCIKFIDKPAKA